MTVEDANKIKCPLSRSNVVLAIQAVVAAIQKNLQSYNIEDMGSCTAPNCMAWDFLTESDKSGYCRLIGPKFRDTGVENG